MGLQIYFFLFFNLSVYINELCSPPDRVSVRCLDDDEEWDYPILRASLGWMWTMCHNFLGRIKFSLGWKQFFDPHCTLVSNALNFSLHGNYWNFFKFINVMEMFVKLACVIRIFLNLYIQMTFFAFSFELKRWPLGSEGVLRPILRLRKLKNRIRNKWGLVCFVVTARQWSFLFLWTNLKSSLKFGTIFLNGKNTTAVLKQIQKSYSLIMKILFLSMLQDKKN